MRLISFASLLLLFALPAAAEESRVALIIGNGKYVHTTALSNPLNDATELALALERLEFEVVRGMNLGQEEVTRTLDSFAGIVKGAEVAVFFYAGHGLQIDGRNYLVPVDFDPLSKSALSSQLVSLDRVLGLLGGSEQVGIVFLDACRDNPFADELKREMSGGRSLSVEGDRAIGVVGQGLAEVESSVGTLIAFATQPGNVALDGTGRHSPFTEALLAEIEEPGLEVSNLMKRVRKQVYRGTDRKQIPWDHSSLVDRFYFKRKTQRSPPPP